MTLASLELNFIRKHDKDLPLPIVVYDETFDSSSGCYYHAGWKTEVVINGRFYDPRKRGLILISTNYGDEDFAGTISHEWRHHWQYYNQKHVNGVSFRIENDDYEASIRNYFKLPWERDALNFEHKFARGPLNSYFMDIVQSR